MGFLLLDQDQDYANQQDFNDHVNSLLNPPAPPPLPVPADVGERGAPIPPALPVSEQGVGPETTAFPQPQPSSPQPSATAAPTPAPLAPVTAPLVAPAQREFRNYVNTTLNAPPGGGEIEQYIRQSAAARGIDPNTAVRVALSEGGLTDPVAQSRFIDPNTGKREPSFGPFQLFLGGGIGNAALNAGIDPRDPNQWRQGVDFALNAAAQGGWGPWHGAARAGIGQFEGIGTGQQAAGPAPVAGQDWQMLALGQLNKPYIWGSGSGAGGRGAQDIDPQTGLPRGFDCSGYVSWVLKNGMGVDLPAQVGQAYQKVATISADQARPGDIVFYDPTNPDPTKQHMALYLGDGKIVEAGGVARNVNIADVNGPGQPIFARPAGAGASPVQTAVGAALQAGQDMASSVAGGVQSLGRGLQNLGGAVQDDVSAFNNHVKQLTGGLVDLGATSQSAEGPFGSPVVPGASSAPSLAGGLPESISGLSQGAVGATAPSGPPVGTLPPPAAGPEPPSMWDRLGQGISDVFRNVFGGAPSGLGQVGATVPGNVTMPPTAPPTETAQNAPGALGEAVTNLAQSPYLPTNLTNAGLRVVGQAVAPLAANPLEAAEDYTQIQQKYGGGIGADGRFHAPDYSNITPEDQAVLNKATGAVGGVVGAGGPERPEVTPPQATDPVIQNLIDQAKARGLDTSALEAQLKPPVEAPAPSGAAPPIPPAEPLPATPVPPVRAGITPDTIQMAHGRIDGAIDPGQFPAENTAAHAQLDQMLASGAAPDEIARFLSGQVEKQSVSIPGIIRSVRTGSMAGGLTTEAKVLVGPVIQTAMRAPVGALKAIVTGNLADIPAGLQGGLSGLAEGAQEALQTIRYGVNYRAALTGGAQGGYGFAPGLDVMGSNVAQRLAGTAAVGLVRTHGAMADISAAIGRGANLATGATPEAAAAAGEQWALRSGEYGMIGNAVAKMFDGLRSTNPALDILGQIVMPFYRVGYNVFTQGVERSPVGLLGRLTDAMQGKPFDTAKLSNNLFGVGLAATGMVEASQGNITGENPQGGAPKWSARVAGQWVPLRALGPPGEALAQAASLYEAARDGRGNVAQIAEQTAQEYASHVIDETWLRSVADIGGLLGDVRNLGGRQGASALRDLQYRAGNIPKSFIPQQTLGSQVQKAVQSAQTGFQAPTVQRRSAAPTAPRAPAAPRAPVAPRR